MASALPIRSKPNCSGRASRFWAAACNLDALPAHLRFERIGNADAIAAGIVEYVDTRYFQDTGIVVRHAWPLKGIGRDHAKVDRWSRRPVDLCKLRIGD